MTENPNPVPKTIEIHTCAHGDVIFDDKGNQLSEVFNFKGQRYILADENIRELPK